ncbi:MAG: hypothetical protein NDJ89_08830 [Oligoflexia bacterium]|nr:hypothetical protein [Oligoflexia bacterium]
MRDRRLALALWVLCLPLGLPLAACALSGATGEAHAAESASRKPRKTKLAWEALDGASRYDFELSARESMSPILKKESSPAPSLALMLRPGTYFFRIRGLTAEGVAGPWSDVTRFEVKLAPQTLLGPGDHESFADFQGNPTITFRWQAQEGQAKYVFELYEGPRKILERQLEKEILEWKPTRPGRYRWRAGYRHSEGKEWSPFRSFSIRPEAFAPPEIPATAKAAPDAVAIQKAREAKLAAGSETWLLARLAQSVVAYSVQDYDSGQNAAGAALVGLFSAELRYRAPRFANSPWGLSAALNLEVIRQNVLETSFTLPRGYARLFATRMVNEDWRLGPFVQLSVNRSGIFIVQGATQALMATITRKSPGVGVTAVYRPSPTLLLSFIGLLRLDMGGTADTLPGPVDSNLGYEAGFGMGLNLSENLLLETRLRVLEEGFTWAPRNSVVDTPGARSALTDTFVIFDAGLGYRF